MIKFGQAMSFAMKIVNIVSFLAPNLVKKNISCENGQNIVIYRQKCRHRSKLREKVEKFFSLKYWEQI